MPECRPPGSEAPPFSAVSTVSTGFGPEGNRAFSKTWPFPAPCRFETAKTASAADAAHPPVAFQETVEIGDGPGEAGVERHLRLPLELLARQGDVGAALHRIVDRQRLEDQLRFAVHELEDLLR